MLLLLLEVRPALAELSEDQIKTAYVLNFIKFAEWPDGITTNDTLTLCVAGNNTLGGALSTLEGYSAGKRKLHVVNFSASGNKAGSCHILYIGESEQFHFSALLKSLNYAPILTISDIDDFAEKGGCIGLRFRDNKIVFEVNMTTVHQSKLKLPGQLLNLAFYVFGG
jgi:hypothetical protein